MFTHVMVGAHDLAASKKFYDAVLGAIGLPAGQAHLLTHEDWRVRHH
jgi:catechol 2,3-dioxygenase-like lactoylglutathione lyase family enzyme